ncbi:hypothetical protein PIB30_008576 [Stylosanthes scabra]|uniref:Uncharacterized protein n=1 Tax=Stylosanthes scabra TaxID=79078 RepID=A0ABU6Q556_9FABA|nr:hypothetical protein [Stylosanthes scabra]
MEKQCGRITVGAKQLYLYVPRVSDGVSTLSSFEPGYQIGGHKLQNGEGVHHYRQAAAPGTRLGFHAKEKATTTKNSATVLDFGFNAMARKLSKGALVVKRVRRNKKKWLGMGARSLCFQT